MANIKQSSHLLQRMCQWTLTSHWTALWKGEGSLKKWIITSPSSPYPYPFSIIMVCFYYNITWKSHSGLEPWSARFCINMCKGATFAPKNEYPQSSGCSWCEPSSHMNVGITMRSCLSCCDLNQRRSKSSDRQISSGQGKKPKRTQHSSDLSKVNHCALCRYPFGGSRWSFCRIKTWEKEVNHICFNLLFSLSFKTIPRTLGWTSGEVYLQLVVTEVIYPPTESFTTWPEPSRTQQIPGEMSKGQRGHNTAAFKVSSVRWVRLVSLVQ